MTAPIPIRIRDVLIGRLETIRQAAGFNTDLGLAIYPGRGGYALQDVTDCPRANVYAAGEAPRDFSGNQQRIEREFAIEAFSAYADDADAVAELLLADIKAAVFIADQPRLADAAGQLTQKLEYVSAAIDLPTPGEQMVSVTVTVRCTYFERYGAPTLTA